MDKPLPKKPLAKKQPVLHRCIAETSVLSVRWNYSRRFGPGQIVDLEESIGDGKLHNIVKPGTFKPIEDSIPSAPREKSK